MVEFIDRPCGWDRLAPARLRRRAVDGVSGWRDYSTARFVAGLDPVVLHTADVSGSPPESGVQVELLPEAVARGWRSRGLELATEASMSNMGFPRILERSLDLVRTIPPLLGTVTGLCRSLHVLAASGRDVDVSCSDPSLPFSVFVSCPPAAERNRVERLAENIVHEALHLQLSLVETIEPLVTDDPDEPPVFSPWRNEPRSVRGLVHAVYVFGNIRHFWKRVAAELPESSSFARSRIEAIDSEMDAAKQLSGSRTLTTAGRRLATSFLDSR